MNRLPVSTILAVRNGERFLGQAIESVLAEPIAELIIVDDGSTDGTHHIISEFERRDSRVILLRTDATTGSGVGAARNLGLKTSVLPYIAFMDADDIWLPGKTKRQLEKLGYERMAYASSDVDHFLEPGYELPKSLRADKLGRISLFFPPNFLAHRYVFEVVGGFDPGLVCANDVDWYRRALALGVTRRHVPEILVRKRVHSSNLSMGQGHDMAQQLLIVARRKVEPRMFPVIQHRCAQPQTAKHGKWGPGIDECYEKDGEYWIDNGEYSSQVNFCPVCGTRAPVQVAHGA